MILAGRRPHQPHAGITGPAARFSVALVVVWCLAAAPAAAADAFDPLISGPARAGQLEYELVAAVLPTARLSADDSKAEQPTLQAEQRYRVGAGISADYWVTPRLVVHAAMAAGGTAVRYGPPGEADPPWSWSGRSGEGTIGAGWRLTSGPPWEAQVQLRRHGGGDPAWTIGLHATRTTDPVVLSGGIDVTRRDGQNALDLTLASRAVFVANERVSFVAGVSQLFPGKLAIAPVTTLSMGVYYALGGDSRHGFGMEALLAAQAGAVQAGLRLVWHGSSRP